MMNPQLAYSLTDRFGIASMSKGEPIQAGGDQCTCALLFQTRPRFAKRLRLFEHKYDVV